MIKLLLVDDEVLRTTLTEALEHSGFAVTTALNVHRVAIGPARNRLIESVAQILDRSNERARIW